MTSGNFICNPCMLLRIKFVWPMTRAYFYFIFSQQNRHLIRKIKFYVCIIIHKPLHCCVSHYYVLKMEKCVYSRVPNNCPCQIIVLERKISKNLKVEVLTIVFFRTIKNYDKKVGQNNHPRQLISLKDNKQVGDSCFYHH